MASENVLALAAKESGLAPARRPPTLAPRPSPFYWYKSQRTERPPAHEGA